MKTNQWIHEKVWFPGTVKLVESIVKSCITCQASHPVATLHKPLRPTLLLPEAWSFLTIDFTGIFLTGDYLLVVINKYNRFTKVEMFSSTSARTIVPKLEAIFSHQGILFIIKTDNGLPIQQNDIKCQSILKMKFEIDNKIPSVTFIPIAVCSHNIQTNFLHLTVIDNWPEFSNFTASLGIEHRKITLLWPKADREVEWFMASLNKTIGSSIAKDTHKRKS